MIPRRPVLVTSPLDVVGARVRHYRQQRRLTLREVAHQAGLSTEYLCDIEHARRQAKRPNAQVMYDLARALGVRIEDLLGRRRLKGGPARIASLPTGEAGA